MVEKIFYLLYILLGVPLAVVCFSSLFAGKGPKTPVENENGGGVDYSTMLSVFVECRREWVAQKRGGGVYLTAVVDALRNGVAVPIPVAAMALEETRREAQRNAGPGMGGGLLNGAMRMIPHNLTKSSKLIAL